MNAQPPGHPSRQRALYAIPGMASRWGRSPEASVRRAAPPRCTRRRRGATGRPRRVPRVPPPRGRGAPESRRGGERRRHGRCATRRGAAGRLRGGRPVMASELGLRRRARDSAGRRRRWCRSLRRFARPRWRASRRRGTRGCGRSRRGPPPRGRSAEAASGSAARCAACTLPGASIARARVRAAAASLRQRRCTGVAGS